MKNFNVKTIKNLIVRIIKYICKKLRIFTNEIDENSYININHKKIEVNIEVDKISEENTKLSNISKVDKEMYDKFNKIIEDTNRRINLSMARFTNTNVNDEEYLINTSNILIISENKEEEENIKVGLNSFKNKEYILKNETNINPYLRSKDCIIFNGINGEEKSDIEYMENVMSIDKTKAYLFYHETKRSNISANHKFFTFANTKITLYSALINLLRFRQNSKEVSENA
ncbi:NARF domain-containing protein [Peptostreptococcaceae bacterium AGR-M142]